MKELIEKLFKDLNNAELYHLNTKLYSAHKALGSFYENLSELVDKLIESYQGKYGLINGLKIEAEITSNIINYYEESVAYIENMRNNMDNYLQNIIDEIVAEYYSLLYKLKNLR